MLNRLEAIFFAQRLLYPTVALFHRLFMFFKRKKVDSFKSFTLSISRMSSSHAYEAVCEGSMVTIRVCNRNFPEADERYLMGEFQHDTESFIKLLNDCRLMKWDDFLGTHSRRVMNGTSFVMLAVVNDGKRISAAGSQNFPKGYHELERSLYQMFMDSQGSDENRLLYFGE